MKVVAISAANIRHRPEGTSLKLARAALERMQTLLPDVTTELIALVDKEVQPCVGCGGCAFTHICERFSDDFSRIYQQLLTADALIVVTAHYAPIPAKLCALFERVESISFLGWHNDPDFARPLAGKPYAVIGHCGAPQQIWESYYDVIFAPVKNALGFPVSMQPVKTGEWPYIGVMLGPSEIRKEADNPFPVQVYDESLIEQRIEIVARSLAKSLLNK